MQVIKHIVEAVWINSVDKNIIFIKGVNPPIMHYQIALLITVAFKKIYTVLVKYKSYK